MVFRVISIVLISSIFYSCQNLSSNKNDITLDATAIDFSTVDVSPGFANCKKFLGTNKTKCFRETMQQKFAKELQQESFITEGQIQETITVVLRINNKGLVTIKEIDSSDMIKEQLPILSSKIKSIVKSLPKLYPATKRGIPVSTEYQLPIQIHTSNLK